MCICGHLCEYQTSMSRHFKFGCFSRVQKVHCSERCLIRRYSQIRRIRDKRIFQLKNSITTLVYGDGIGVGWKLSSADSPSTMWSSTHDFRNDCYNCPIQWLSRSDDKFDRVFIGGCRTARTMSLYSDVIY